MAPWLEGLLPDRPDLLSQWRRHFGIADNETFSLLRHVGEDVAGAAQFVRSDRLVSVLEGGAPQLTSIDEAGVAERLRRAKANLPITDDVTLTGKFSLAGMQAKIALHRTAADQWADPSGSTPSTHILKPAIPGMVDQDLAEVITMRASKSLGLETAACTVEEFEDERAFVTTRFDRRQGQAGQWLRVHQEDMCQALGIWPSKKYESQGGPSAAVLAGLIHRHGTGTPGEDNERFARALIFNWLMCGTDAHARNYSVLMQRDQVRLAPLYDLNSHLAFSDGSGNALSMSVGGTFIADRISRHDWANSAPALYLDEQWLFDEIDQISTALPDAVSDAAGAADVRRFESRLPTRLVDQTSSWVAGLRKRMFADKTRHA